MASAAGTSPTQCPCSITLKSACRQSDNLPRQKVLIILLVVSLLTVFFSWKLYSTRQEVALLRAKVLHTDLLDDTRVKVEAKRSLISRNQSSAESSQCCTTNGTHTFKNSSSFFGNSDVEDEVEGQDSKVPACDASYSPCRESPGPRKKWATGTVFTVWGREECPQNADMIYSGYPAGTHSTAGVADSSSLECLPLSPMWYSNAASTQPSRISITAARISLGNNADVKYYGRGAEEIVIPCSVCLSPGATTMLPGWSHCPHSWVEEYSGYLMSSIATEGIHFTGGRNYCFHKDPKVYSGLENSFGPQITFAQAGPCSRGEPLCNHYVQHRKISCVVCTTTS